MEKTKTLATILSLYFKIDCCTNDTVVFKSKEKINVESVEFFFTKKRRGASNISLKVFKFEKAEAESIFCIP